MKIAIFTDTYHPMVNGVIVSIDNLTKNLAKRGHKIMIFTVYGGAKPKPPKGITVHYSKGMSLPTMKDLKIAVPNTVGILKKVKQFNPDVIHSMTAFGMGSQGLICAKALNKPIVYTEHGMLTAYTKYISPSQIKGFGKLELLFKTSLGIQINIFSLITANLLSNYNNLKIKMSSIIKNENKKKVNKLYNQLSLNSKKINNIKDKKDQSFFNKIIWHYFLTFHNNSDIVSTPSEPMKEYMEKHGTKQKIIAISNGIDRTVFKKLNIKKSENFKIIHVGRVSWEKNIDIVIKSVAQVAKKYPKTELHVCGVGPQLEEMKKLVESLNLGKNVKFLGLVEHKKLPQHYSSSNLFITASTIETEGLVMLEAMSCGIPVIAVDALAAPHVVQNGENGYIVPVNDYKKMSEKIINLMENRELLINMSKNALNSSKKYDLQKIIDRWENIYFDIIKQKNNFKK